MSDFVAILEDGDTPRSDVASERLVNQPNIREIIEQREVQILSPYAALACKSKGRNTPEPDDPVRTIFQRDRDRILHSKPFRRLKHKTQVFIAPKGDHYRTRLTHTLDVAQISRTMGRALKLNEDLIEAVALGHDVGHPPFGHAGEAALDEVLQDLRRSRPDAPEKFRHYDQSLHVLMNLEKLNLCAEVQAGISGHSKGESDLSASDGQLKSSLEAACVRIADRIAYMNHDLDDAVRSGIIEKIPSQFTDMFGDTHGVRVGRMVEDVIFSSYEQPAIRLSEPMLSALNELKDWLFEHVYYRYPQVVPEIEKSKKLVKELFLYYCDDQRLPEGFEGIQGAIDYVSGMTDRFAIEAFERLRVPKAFAGF